MEPNLAATAAAPALDPCLQAPLAWSRWSRCQSSFSLALTPRLPGVFALGEEVVAPADGDASDASATRRMLALLQVSATDDLAGALDRLFAPASPLRERLESGRCFLRYAVIPDRVQREAVYVALLHWLAASSETAAAIAQGLPAEPRAESVPARQEDSAGENLGPPPPLPAGF